MPSTCLRLSGCESAPSDPCDFVGTRPMCSPYQQAPTKESDALALCLYSPTIVGEYMIKCGSHVKLAHDLQGFLAMTWCMFSVPRIFIRRCLGTQISWCLGLTRMLVYLALSRQLPKSRSFQPKASLAPTLKEKKKELDCCLSNAGPDTYSSFPLATKRVHVMFLVCRTPHGAGAASSSSTTSTRST